SVAGDDGRVQIRWCPLWSRLPCHRRFCTRGPYTAPCRLLLPRVSMPFICF
ncbi:Os12g0299300, partial [Oryza sativa Japonica Group]